MSLYRPRNRLPATSVKANTEHLAFISKLPVKYDLTQFWPLILIYFHAQKVRILFYCDKVSLGYLQSYTKIEIAMRCADIATQNSFAFLAVNESATTLAIVMAIITAAKGNSGMTFVPNTSIWCML